MQLKTSIHKFIHHSFSFLVVLGLLLSSAVFLQTSPVLAAPPAMADQTFTVIENSATGTIVGTIAATGANSFTILSGNESGAFSLNSSSGQISVADGTQIDYETTPSFSLLVEATNGDGPTQATMTINVLNANDAPVVADQSFTIAENSPNGTSVGIVVASDPDPGNVLTYNIVGGNTGGAFAIGSGSGEITVADATAVDFETTPTFELLVSVSDGGLISYATMTIDLTDANDPPVAVDDADAAYTTAENTPLTITTPTVLDNDTDQDGDSLTAVLDTDAGFGSVTLNSDGTFTYTPDTNFNGNDSFTYFANDGAVNSNEPATVSITVTGVDDPPTANDDPGYTTAEDTTLNVDAPGILANDVEPEGQALTAHLEADVSSGTLALAQNGSFIYTPALDFTGTVTFTYHAEDSVPQASNTATVTITVTAENDPPTLNDDTFSLPENSANGTPVGTVAASDPDSGDTLTYAILSGNAGGAFALNSSTGEITVADSSALDYETTPSFVLTVEVEDSGLETDEATITVNLTDANDDPTGIDLSSSSVPENQPAGTPVGTFTTDDQDSGDSHAYTLVAGTGDTDNGSFTISGDQLLTAASFDYETKNSYSIRVQTDDGNGGIFARQFTITITNANEPPTDINLSPDTIVEHQPVGTTVGTLTATDPDGGAGNTFTLVAGTGSTHNSSFTISGDQLLTAADLDFETVGTYNIRVRVNDGSGGAFEEALTVTVTDGNDPPTDIDLTPASVEENQPAGAVVGTLTATDPNGTDTHTFTLVSGTGSADNGSFTINGDQLETAASFNFENDNSYTIRVQADDGNGGTYAEAFTITITDTNDDPTNINLTPASVAENQAPGSTVGTLTSADEDSTDSHTYTLVAGTGDVDNGSFTINGDQLETAATFDYETQNSYSIRVQTDDGNGGVFARQLTVTITDANDDPTDITLFPASVAENQPTYTEVGTFATVDPDAGDTFTYSLVAGAGDTGNGSFLILGNKLYTAATFDLETQSSYSIRVQTEDGGGATFQKAFTITIVDAADVPTAVDDSGATDEDSLLTVPVGSSLLNNDTDDDGDVLTVSSADTISAQGAVVAVAADGSYTYDPRNAAALQALAVGDTLVDTFTYTASDGGLTDQATVSITVTGVNDAPVAVDDNLQTPPETAAVLTVLDNDTDVENESLTITAVTQGSHGTVVINGDGTLTYTPEAGYTGADTFTYTIEDEQGASDTATVNMTVNLFQVFLPFVGNNVVAAPDLVITSVTASSDLVEVVVENQGNAATQAGFWVDFYVDPDPAPDGPNQLWQELSEEGIAWGVTDGLAPGASLTLRYSTDPNAPNLYVVDESTNFIGSLPPGTAVYAQVDSAHQNVAYGAIEELHEILGTPYNNVFGPVEAVAPAASLSDSVVETAAVSTEIVQIPVADLPRR